MPLPYLHLIIPLIPLYMGLTSRLHGSSIKTPKVLDGALYALPYALLVLLTNNLSTGYLYALFTLIWVVIWKNKGHADGFRKYQRDISIFTPISIWISSFVKADRNSYTYDFIFWCVKGFFISIIPAILIGSVWVGVLGTLAYGVSYWVGYTFGKSWATEIGEFLGGVIAGVGLII